METAKPFDGDTAPHLVGRVRRTLVVIMQTMCLITGFSIAVTLLLGVLWRYVFKSSLAWSAELPNVLFPWLIMSGATLGVAHHQHLGVNYFVAKLSHHSRCWITLGIDFLMISVLLTLSIISFDLMSLLGRQTTPVLFIPRSWAFASLPFGLSAMAVAIGTNAANRMSELSSSKRGIR